MAAEAGEGATKISCDRILTTHVGSLPRSAAVMDLLQRRERGEPYDLDAFNRTIRAAVADIVRRQATVGVDVVSDGETSKFGYATYIKDRLEGFGSEAPAKPALDMRDYAELRRRMTVASFSAAEALRRSCCIGPVSLKDRSALQMDLANFRAALDSADVAEGFLNAASPGVITSFQENRYYPSHEAYVTALAEVMREEYEAVTQAGFILQLDCPDLAMSRHTSFQDLTEAEFLKRAELHVEALNHALAAVPADAVRMHICWGNYEGPHDHDIALEKIMPILRKAKPRAISFEASNPRHEHEWVVWRDARLPDDKILIPGVLDTTTNFIEHPELVAQRIIRFADIVGRERVIAGTDCGFGTIAGFSKVDPEIAFRKLAAMAEGAAIASDRLFRRRPAAGRGAAAPPS
jgi:5-methyltetrahydropteroyltriglutamate--homocysteine methyltransferase